MEQKPKEDSSVFKLPLTSTLMKKDWSNKNPQKAIQRAKNEGLKKQSPN
jgi:hypothetical protein